MHKAHGGPLQGCISIMWFGGGGITQRNTDGFFRALLTLPRIVKDVFVLGSIDEPYALGLYARGA